MIALALAAAAAAAAAAGGLGLAELPPQALPPGACLTFLWTKTPLPVRIAMIDEQTGTIRVMERGRQVDAPRTAPGTYKLGNSTLFVDLVLVNRAGLTGGNIVETGSIRRETPGADTVVVAVGGIRGCA